MDSVHMGDVTPPDVAATAGQQADVGRLHRRPAGDRCAAAGRAAVPTAAATGTIGAPVSYTRLLRTIVATAADMVDARAASLFLIDAEHENLVLEVIEGDQTPESLKSRLPLG